MVAITNIVFHFLLYFFFLTYLGLGKYSSADMVLSEGLPLSIFNNYQCSIWAILDRSFKFGNEIRNLNCKQLGVSSHQLQSHHLQQIIFNCCCWYAKTLTFLRNDFVMGFFLWTFRYWSKQLFFHSYKKRKHSLSVFYDDGFSE